MMLAAAEAAMSAAQPSFDVGKGALKAVAGVNPVTVLRFSSALCHFASSKLEADAMKDRIHAEPSE